MSDKDDAGEPRKGTRTVDVELSAMSRITAALSSLDGEARQRVLAWLLSRYAPVREEGDGKPIVEVPS